MAYFDRSDIKEMARDSLRKSPVRIKEGLEYTNELRAESGIVKLSPSEYLTQWGFEETEISELLKKAGYVV